MKKIAGILGLLLILLAAHAWASSERQSSAVSPKSAAADTPEPMKRFLFVAGTWIPDSSAKRKLSEEYSFTPILEGRFLSSEEIYKDEKGAIVYRDFAVYGMDPDTKRLFFHAYNTDGSMDRSKEIETSSAGAWIFEGTVYGSERFKDYRYSITRVDENHMRVLIELKKDGVFSKYAETLYQRKV